jgi:hypothetical protein
MSVKAITLNNIRYCNVGLYLIRFSDENDLDIFNIKFLIYYAIYNY